MTVSSFALAAATVALTVSFAVAQDTQDAPSIEVEPRMTIDRLAEIALAVDPEAEVSPSRIQLTVADLPVLVVMDPAADRMRAFVPIRSSETMSEEELMRVMQANFDTALDARYAVANGRLWAVFIHPLGPLERDQFLSALGQTVNLALSYGTLYSGGAMSFGNGDSGALQRQLIEDLLNKGQDI